MIGSKQILVALVGIGIATTALTFREAVLDRSALRRLRQRLPSEQAVDANAEIVARQTVRHEALRLTKHVLLFGTVALGEGWGVGVAGFCTWMVAAVSLLLTLSSLLDLRDRHRVLSSLRATLGQSVEKRQP